VTTWREYTPWLFPSDVDRIERIERNERDGLYEHGDPTSAGVHGWPDTPGIEPAYWRVSN
jgi:hypothetical protein